MEGHTIMGSPKVTNNGEEPDYRHLNTGRRRNDQIM